jgi:hypothetical protein
MNPIKHTSLKPVVVSLAAAILATSVAAPAGAASHKDAATSLETDIVQYHGWGDPEMADMAVNSGKAVISHLESAQALLDEGKIDQARSALIAGREFADAIQRMMPYLSVVEEMQDAGDRVVQEDIQAFSADLLPIYASLDDLEIYAPDVAKQSRGMVKQAGRRDKQRAARESQDAATVAAGHTVYLPVDFVDGQLRAALNAVNRSKPDVAEAKAAVGRALDSLTTVVDMVADVHGK